MGDSAPAPVESYRAIVGKLAAVLLALAAIGLGIVRRERPTPPPAPAQTASPALTVAETREETPPPPPTLDREAVARAEAALDATRRSRREADDRAAEAEARLAAAAREAGHALTAAQSLAGKVRDPSSRLASAETRGGIVKAERDRLKAELAALDGTAKPRAKPLVDKSPVARMTDGEEFHFEVRNGRVAFIDLERLLERVKADARMRIRISDLNRGIEATVGPIGAFSMHYEMGRTDLGVLSDVLRERGPTFSLRSWEVVPEREGRGETYEQALSPVSEFGRAVNRLSPSRDTITLWVYPDGFPLYRRLRDMLHARGFLVAGRPLPDGMAIRGSPAGSLSAGQ